MTRGRRAEEGHRAHFTNEFGKMLSPEQQTLRVRLRLRVSTGQMGKTEARRAERNEEPRATRRAVPGLGLRPRSGGMAVASGTRPKRGRVWDLPPLRLSSEPSVQPQAPKAPHVPRDPHGDAVLRKACSSREAQPQDAPRSAVGLRGPAPLFSVSVRNFLTQREHFPSSTRDKARAWPGPGCRRATRSGGNGK